MLSYFYMLKTPGVLHEHPRIGSDGESEEVSLASDPDVTSPVKMRQKNRRLSEACQMFPPPPSPLLFYFFTFTRLAIDVTLVDQ